MLQAYTLRHQRASDAVALVYPLLSRKGTVELQPGGNTLVIRDVQTALDRIVPVLRSFDHAPRPMRLEVLIVKASRNAVSPQVRHSDLPDQLTKRLRDLLAYDNFETQAQAQLGGVEGQPVIYDLGQDYKVSFHFGTPDGRPAGEAVGVPHLAQGRGAAGSQPAADQPHPLVRPDHQPGPRQERGEPARR